MIRQDSRCKQSILFAIISILIPHLALHAKLPDGWDPATISVQLKDSDRNIQETAIFKINRWFGVDPQDAARRIRHPWGQQLLEAKRYQELADWAQQGVLAMPWDTPVIEDLLVLRVKALSAMGRAQDALAVSKSLFNLARPQKTPAALLLIAQCLEKANPSDKDIYSKFQAEQIAGAAQEKVRSSLIDGIEIDAKPYEALMGKYEKSELSDNKDILALGNLQLIAGLPKDARVTFALIDPRNEKLFAESIARAIKAVDGTLAGANQYLLEPN